MISGKVDFAVVKGVQAEVWRRAADRWELASAQYTIDTVDNARVSAFKGRASEARCKQNSQAETKAVETTTTAPTVSAEAKDKEAEQDDKGSGAAAAGQANTSLAAASGEDDAKTSSGGSYFMLIVGVTACLFLAFYAYRGERRKVRCGGSYSDMLG